MKHTLLAQSLNFYQEAASQDLPGVSGDLSNSSDRGFGNFLSGILSAIMAVAALMVLLYLIWGAITWITSGGDKGKIETARNRMTQAIVGIIVLAASLAIFMAVQSFLGIKILNFSGGATKLNPDTSCAARSGACRSSCVTGSSSVGQMNCGSGLTCCVAGPR
jgi:hypothetical protein